MRNRDEVVSLVKQETALTDAIVHFYRLVHTYDEREDVDTGIYVLSKIPYDRMNLLIAYIQFKSSGLAETFGLSQEDVGKILSDLYGCKLVTPEYEDAGEGEYRVGGFDIEVYDHINDALAADRELYEIDLYINWEQWCGIADEIEEIGMFHHDELKDHLLRIIPESSLNK